MSLERAAVLLACFSLSSPALAEEPALLPPPPPTLDGQQSPSRCQQVQMAFDSGRGLVAEESSHISFQATCPVSGVVVASDGTEVARFRSDAAGRGGFEFVPSAGTAYSVRVLDPPGITVSFPLPRPRVLALQLRSSLLDERTPRTGFHLERRPRWGLIIAGLGMFVGTSVINLGIGLDTVGQLAIPVYGPLYVGGTLLAANSGGWAAIAVPAGFWLIVDGLAQVAGLALVIAGAVGREVEVPDQPSVAVSPMLLPGGGGLAVVGRF